MPGAQRSPTLLSFEMPDALERWRGDPRDTLDLDDQVAHSGTRSARIRRDASSEEDFSSICRTLPVDFAGDTVGLVGWLRLRDVEGVADLWLRLDGLEGSVGFVDLGPSAPSGTADWARFTLRLSMDAQAREIVVGATLRGEGTLWVDDLELDVDGEPLVEAPWRELPPEAAAWTVSPEFAKGSGTADIEPTEARVRDLVLLGKVWGFVKYHHARVIAGEVNHDEQLFRVLPRVLACGDRASAQAVLLAWIDELGPQPSPSSCAALPPAEALHLVPELGWLADEALLGSELSARLREIHARRPTVSAQHYVELAPGVGNPLFSAELRHRGLSPLDAGLRLLTVLRFWNIIAYWFPYRDQLDDDWDEVLAEAVAQACAATSPDDYALAILALVARVHDTHANLWSSIALRPPRGPGDLPVEIRFVEGQPMVEGVFGDASGLQVGDVVREIDGTPVQQLLASWTPWYAASNAPTRLRDQGRRLLCGPIGPVALTVERDQQESSLSAERIPVVRGPGNWRFHDHPGPALRRLSDELAYLTLSSVVLDQTAEYVRQAEGASALVIDLRNYPSAFVVFALGQHLVAEPTPFARFTTGDPNNPGAFPWGMTVELEPVAPRFTGRVAILVDETTQSQAEYTAMALRTAPGALVVGSQTAGADGNVSHIFLPGGLYAMISGIGVFTPDGRPTQRIGIVPDLVVHPTLRGLRQGLDEVLDAAVFALLQRSMTDGEREGLG